jgi:hypothetical protein
VGCTSVTREEIPNTVSCCHISAICRVLSGEACGVLVNEIAMQVHALTQQELCKPTDERHANAGVRRVERREQLEVRVITAGD